ncbi:hypothetical protein F2P56_013649 [Juglans regia]|uniref:GH18 domain-containing protein n=2 Tax=Juglans regia TaxID=51240 RepID=A0A833XQ71_JUGRE|nr:class V chitinase-like [Juglans regia]KAF5469587.1 hypothetical protein F2P56_013649 [Juglans regia]
MASSDSVVKAGYWIFGRDFNRPVDAIPFELFTHLYAGFAEVNANDGTVTIPEQYSVQFRTFTDTVRVRSPQVKTLLSIGGEGSNISPVVADENTRRTFISSSIDLARSYRFDGLDLCWLYPNSQTDNPENLSSLLQGWRTAAGSLLLTATVFHHRATTNFNYPIQAINEKLDWINVLAVDFYTPKSDSSPEHTGPVHAWRNPREQNKCGSEGIYNWINGIGPNPVKIDTQKLVLGLPFYGYKWTLTDSHQHDFFADAANPPTPAAIAFRNIQADYINLNNAGRLVNDPDMFVASYWHHDVTWIGFDDKHSIATKVKEAIRGYNLRGYFAWDLAADDDNWTLSKAASNARDNAIDNPGTSSTSTSTSTITTGGNTTTITITNTATSTNTNTNTSSVR